MSGNLPESPYGERAAPAPDTPALKGETKAEVCVVGGGFTGLSAALRLAEKGVDTILLEAEEPGFGASGRNGGQIIPGFKHDPEAMIARFGADKGEALAAFAGRAPDLVFELIERHAMDCDAVRSGWLQAAHGSAALPAVESRVRQWRERGAPIELLGAEETERLTGARGYAGALLDARGGTLNPLAFARGLARAALSEGASLHGGSPVTSLREEGGGWRVSTGRGGVRAERVLIATNAYTGDFWPGLAQSVIPVYSYQIATEPLSANLQATIMPNRLGLSDTRRLLNYCRQDAGGRLLVGGRGYRRESTDPDDFQGIRRALGRLFPSVIDVPLRYCWSGRVALTLDHWPHIGELAPGLSIAYGFNGRGVAMATATGRQMAEHLAGAPLETLPLPVRPFKPLRGHGYLPPLLAAAIGVKKLQDWWEMRR
ncbi:MAG: FAD-binding oxidoreductase [Limibacillus sp.]